MNANCHIIMLLVLCSCSVAQLFGQNLYNKLGTTVSISTSGIMSVNDSLINNGTLINNGNLVVGGSWKNLGTYDAGNGQITFNNADTSVPQIINHNNQSFSKLVISGGGLKRILADITVEGSLTLTDGIITAENDSKIVFAPGAVISGGSDQAHIQATVVQQGSGDKLFPLGNGIQYLPVSITEIGSANTGVGITLTELSSPQTFLKNASLTQVSGKRYWTIDVETGSLDGAKIVLPYAGDEGFQASDKTGVAFAASVAETFQSLGRGPASTADRIYSSSSPGTGVVTLGILAEGIVVFNAISPGGSAGQNDYVQIDNIGTEDVFSVYNRWGDLVFEMTGYQNDDPQKRFNGNSNVGGKKELPAGTYFYVIRRKAGAALNGYISLRR